MTLTSETVRNQYAGTGAQTSFDITFIFWDLDDPQVVHRDASGTETTWTRGTQYNVTGGLGAVGTLTVVTAPTDYTPASGETLTIKSNLNDTQDTSLPAGGAFPSTSVEQQLDKIVRLVQQKAEALGRGLTFPVTDASSLSAEIPNSTNRASKILGFDSSGEPVATTVAAAAVLSLGGQTTNMVRVNATETDFEFRTPAQVRSDIGADNATNLTGGTVDNARLSGTISGKALATVASLDLDGVLTQDYDPTLVGDQVFTISTTTSRDIGVFQSSVATEDVNLEVRASSATDVSAGMFFHLSNAAKQKGTAFSIGEVAGVAELSFGIGSTAATGKVFDVNSGTDIKFVIAENANQMFSRLAGFGFGAEPTAFFHITENNSRTNSVAAILKLDTITDGDMADGFGTKISFSVKDAVSSLAEIANIAGLRTFSTDNSGALQFNVASSGALGRAMQLDPNKLATFDGNIDANGDIDVQQNLVLNNATLDAAAADTVRLASADLSAGNTILAIDTEGTPEAAGSATIDRTIAVNINGTIRYLMASDTAAA